MKDIIDKIKSVVRGMMDEVAKLLDFISNGFIEAWHITILSVIGHVVAMLALVDGRLGNAALLIAGFALLDALDGAVARFQKTSSMRGMLLDSTTDRIKETLIYGGLAYYFAEINEPLGSLYAVLALGMSMSVSYVKAKGESVLATLPKDKHKKQDLNREFEDGIFGYEVRMFIIVVALAIGEPLWGVLIVLGGATMTYVTRFNSVSERIHDKD